MDLTSNFSSEEFACKCGCGFDCISPKLVEKLQAIREAYGRPIRITSGCRCGAHNGAVGGVEGSAHTKALAADLSASTGLERFLLAELAIAAGFKRVGIAKTFVHLDIDDTKPSPSLWTY